MPYRSTAGKTPETALPDALFQGLAPDGGLFFPSELPQFTSGELADLDGRSWPETATFLAQKLLGDDLEPETVRDLTHAALDFPLPLIRISERMKLLDLSRGPTLAFKDVGARFMARLMAQFRPEGGEPLTILTATSGDTGGAVAHAFLGLPEIRVVILFPDGKVTPRQERQFSTLGENVQAVAIQGDFDDCQRMAKEAFQDSRLKHSLTLTSANSINIGRFLPQAFYYVWTWKELGGPGGLSTRSWDTKGPSSGTHPPSPLLFAVPSGNFGNLAAGLTAKAMGLPNVRFLAATNINDTVPRYLASGVYRPHRSKRTLSTAMDVGDPSNLARILHLYDGKPGVLRKDLVGISVNDEETRAAIRRAHEEHGVILDPHTAVGFSALETELKRQPEMRGVLLVTASPAKFAEVVEPILGERLPIPPQLARGLEGDRRVTPLEPRYDALRELLLA